jgi:hypothetical protein
MNAVAKEAAPTKQAKFDIFEVALPKIQREGGFAGGPRGSIYPVDQLKVGQAFFVPANEEFLPAKDEEGKDLGHYDAAGEVTREGLVALNKRIVGSVARLAKQHNLRVAVRTLKASEDPEKNPWGVAGVGVWREEGGYNFKPKAA